MLTMKMSCGAVGRAEGSGEELRPAGEDCGVAGRRRHRDARHGAAQGARSIRYGDDLQATFTALLRLWQRLRHRLTSVQQIDAFAAPQAM